MSRQEIYNSYTGKSRMRPNSAELADLHVYIVPPELWRERYNNLLNQNVTETISAGIIRVHPDTRVCNLRDELESQLGAELLPRDYIFLKSVGRSITRLKPKQEFQLKVKHFLPPNSYAPELYLLEVENRDDENETTGSTRPTTRSPQFTESEDERQSNRYRQKPRNATSPYRYTSPLPKIKSDRVDAQKTHENLPHYDQNGDFDRENRVPVNNSWGGEVPETRRSPRYSPANSRRTPPPRSPPPSNDYPLPQNDYPPPHQNDYPSPPDYPDNSRLKESPPNSGEKDKPVSNSHQPVASKYDPRSATYTNQTNDSGIAGLTPEEYRENYDDAERRKNEYNESRQKELQNRLNGHEDDGDHQRQLREDRERDEWERKRREEDERRRREEEERRRREDDERQREEDERRRREEEREKMAREKLSGSDEDLNRFPSPPPMHVPSSIQGQDTTNLTKEQKQAEKKRLLQELEAAREARRAIERQREELVKKAKLMQNKTQNRRNHARDLWKKRYFEEKKRTPPLEEQCNKLRHELDVIHRKLMNALEGSSKDKNTRMENLKPSKQVGSGEQDDNVPFGFISYDGSVVKKQFRRAHLSENSDKNTVPPSRGRITSDYGRYDMASAHAERENRVKEFNPRQAIQSDYGHYHTTKTNLPQSEVVEILKTVNFPTDKNSSQSDMSIIGKDDVSSILSDQISDSKSIQSSLLSAQVSDHKNVQSEQVLQTQQVPKLPFSFSPLGSWMNPNKRNHVISKSAKNASPILSPKSKRRPTTKDGVSPTLSPKSVQFGKAYYY